MSESFFLEVRILDFASKSRKSEEKKTLPPPRLGSNHGGKEEGGGGNTKFQNLDFGHQNVGKRF